MTYAPVAVMWANRRWGRGRLWQLATRAFCFTFGHRFTAWFEDWDEDQPPPHPEIRGLWHRGCRRECGIIQTATTTRLQLEAGALTDGDDLWHRWGSSDRRSYERRQD
jgi:hypothetical protein